MSSPSRLLRGRRPTPLPTHYTWYPSGATSEPDDTPIAEECCTTSADSEIGVTAETVREYLRFNHRFLEDYILQDVPQEALERLLIRKAQKNESESQTSSSLAKWKFCVHTDKQELIRRLTNELQEGADLGRIIFQLSEAIAEAVNADSFGVYLVDESQQPSVLASYPTTGGSKMYNIGEGMSIASYVAATQTVVHINSLEQRNDPRFPRGILLQDTAIGPVLCVPIQSGPESETAKLVGVLELGRKASEPAFGTEDEEIIQSYLAWAAIALQSGCVPSNPSFQQYVLNNGLLSITRKVLDTTTDMSEILEIIESTATDLVNAHRSSLFLVDEERQELYAHLLSVPAEEKDYVNRRQRDQVQSSSVQDYFNQLSCTLREIVTFKGELVRLKLCV